MHHRTVIFDAPGRATLHLVPPPTLSAGDLLIQTEVSAVSTGTETLLLRGDVDPRRSKDASLATLSGTLEFPLTYGYQNVGTVLQVGANVDPRWRGRRVFSFNPHAELVVARADDVIVLPESLPSERAVWLANMETAVSLIMDAAPVLGEHACVTGQGMVGVMCTALLARYPLHALTVIEPRADRRGLAAALGATSCHAPSHPPYSSDPSWDLAVELSGKPAALEELVEGMGPEGRIIVGSWYGDGQATRALSTAFHRGRLQIQSSQVSTVAPALRGRFTKARRMQIALRELERLPWERFSVRAVPVADCTSAYQRLLQGEEPSLGVSFNYN